ncbi:hypothetical protein AVEN_2657-1 [Araneus ventricosus]|uniref:Secreted protein n=1 Tax=Araneus ventricosus TaxID=182803 RepID=A0A4Y2WCQ4_ARAVE|nr:hypothetical protein AVEN_2657-1 [Araneus ventricosus]
MFSALFLFIAAVVAFASSVDLGDRGIKSCDPVPRKIRTCLRTSQSALNPSSDQMSSLACENGSLKKGWVLDCYPYHRTTIKVATLSKIALLQL